MCDTCRKASVSKRKSTFFFRRQNSTLWLFLKSQPMLPVHDAIHIPRSHFLSGVSIVTSLNDTSAPHARAHLCSCLHLINPCAKRKVLSLTRPKGKIYKTKSLGHYITPGLVQYGSQHSCVIAVKLFLHKFNRHDRCLGKKLFYFIGQVWLQYNR